MPQFGQIMTAMITPFDEAGAVDYDVAQQLAEHLVAEGNDGLVVCGTTGESPTLSTPEKVALFKASVEAVGDRMTIVAGTGSYDTAASVALTQKAAEIGVSGVMAVTPYYSKPPQEGLYRHFTAIADASDLPLLLYNIPGRTARLIEVETLQRLAEHERIVGVKDAVDDLEWTENEIRELPEGFAVYSGSDAMTRGMVSANGVGVVSVAAHFAAPQIKRMVRATIERDDAESWRLHDGLRPLFEALFVEPNPMPLKAGMNAVWGRVGEPRLPLIPASADTTQLIEAAMETVQSL